MKWLLTVVFIGATILFGVSAQALEQGQCTKHCFKKVGYSYSSLSHRERRSCAGDRHKCFLLWCNKHPHECRQIKRKCYPACKRF